MRFILVKVTFFINVLFIFTKKIPGDQYSNRFFYGNGICVWW